MVYYKGQEVVQNPKMACSLRHQQVKKSAFSRSSPHPPTAKSKNTPLQHLYILKLANLSFHFPVWGSFQGYSRSRSGVQSKQTTISLGDGISLYTFPYHHAENHRRSELSSSRPCGTSLAASGREESGMLGLGVVWMEL